MKMIGENVIIDAIHHQMDKYVPDTAGYHFAQGILRYIEKKVNGAEKTEIVYCKDCKWWNDIYHCPMVMYDMYNDETINNAEPEWFCSQGVREE